MHDLGFGDTLSHREVHVTPGLIYCASKCTYPEVLLDLVGTGLGLWARLYSACENATIDGRQSAAHKQEAETGSASVHDTMAKTAPNGTRAYMAISKAALKHYLAKGNQ